jgi:hypothetical protein
MYPQLVRRSNLRDRSPQRKQVFRLISLLALRASILHYYQKGST